MRHTTRVNHRRKLNAPALKKLYKNAKKHPASAIGILTMGTAGILSSVYLLFRLKKH